MEKSVSKKPDDERTENKALPYDLIEMICDYRKNQSKGLCDSCGELMDRWDKTEICGYCGLLCHRNCVGYDGGLECYICWDCYLISMDSIRDNYDYQFENPEEFNSLIKKIDCALSKKSLH